MEEARLWRSEMAANISVCRTLLELPMLHFPKFKNCCEALARVVPIFSSRLTVWWTVLLNQQRWLPGGVPPLIKKLITFFKVLILKFYEDKVLAIHQGTKSAEQNVKHIILKKVIEFSKPHMYHPKKFHIMAKASITICID